MEINWDTLNKTATIITILWIPSIAILYYTMWNKIKRLLKFNKNKYISKRLSDKITFDYSNNNWKYDIWKDKQYFETKFSNAWNQSIHIYNDPPNIEWVAIAKWITEISDIKDASTFDMSSRTRTPNKLEIVILKNTHWNYCALKILDIEYDKNKVSFEYVINSNWYTDFRK